MAVVESFFIIPRSGSFTRYHGIFPGDSIPQIGWYVYFLSWPILFLMRKSQPNRLPQLLHLYV